MLTPLLAVLIVSPQSQGFDLDRFTSVSRKPLLSQLFPRPDGRNGLEFYARAIDLARNNPSVAAIAMRKPGDIPTAQEIADIKPILAEIQKGTKRPVDTSVFLRVVSANTDGMLKLSTISMNFGTGIKEITKAAVGASGVWFDNGNSPLANQNLLMLLKCSHEFKPASLIMSLVGNACDAIVFSAYDDHLNDLRLADISSIVRAATELEDIGAYRKAMLSEARQAAFLSASVFLEFEKEMRKGKELPRDQELRKAAQFYLKCTPAQRSAYPSRVQREISKAYALLLRQLDEPEHRWHFGKSRITYSTDPIMRSIMPASGLELFPDLLVAFAKTRTQMRLLRLHAMIRGYKIRSGRFPETLSALNDRKATYDPLTNSSFAYRGHVTSYTLVSKGIPQTGEIALRYQRKKP